jgi:hypothetical protein
MEINKTKLIFNTIVILALIFCFFYFDGNFNSSPSLGTSDTIFTSDTIIESVYIHDTVYNLIPNSIIYIDRLAGGFAPYTALLTDNITASISSHIMSNDSVLGVCLGNYTVVLTDVNDCPSFVIAGGVNQQLVGYDTITVAEIASLTSPICNASSLGLLTVVNPISSYSYSWENINNTGVVISTGEQADSLSAGFYVLLADDYNNTPGCTATDTFVIALGTLGSNVLTTNIVNTNLERYNYVR